MVVVRGKTQRAVDWEGLWSRMADRAMGKRQRSTAGYPQTAWELVKPLLAKDWHTRAELKRITARNVNESINSHMALLDKRGKYERTQFRLKKT